MDSSAHKRLLVIDAAALSAAPPGVDLTFHTAETVFPALTCPVQASFRTASTPARHGMIANGLYFRDLRKVCFWEQSARLVAGPRIWDGLRRRGGKVAVLFWQQSLGEDADAILSPAPIHKHHGGMIEGCYSKPAGLYERLCRAVGRAFKLRHYWGPLASAKSGQWIAEATAALLRGPDAPHLCLTYLPTLDYALQRKDPAGPEAQKALSALAGQMRLLLDAAGELGYEVVVFGDYAIGPVAGATYPNRALAEAGLLRMRPVAGMLYPDFHASGAFAMVDHQIAHIFAASEGDRQAAAGVLSQLAGIEEVMDRPAQRARGIDHPDAGELVLLAEKGTWFAYPWWTHRAQAPDYAGHVDIHNKPGYDPCELFFGWPPGTVSGDPRRVRGSHGRAGAEGKVAWATTIDLPREPASIIELAEATRQWLDEA